MQQIISKKNKILLFILLIELCSVVSYSQNRIIIVFKSKVTGNQIVLPEFKSIKNKPNVDLINDTLKFFYSFQVDTLKQDNKNSMTTAGPLILNYKKVHSDTIFTKYNVDKFNYIIIDFEKRSYYFKKVIKSDNTFMIYKVINDLNAIKKENFH
ncbi:MAG: hypothetical protein WCP69_12285 [Bacteroidota bacterium]